MDISKNKDPSVLKLAQIFLTINRASSSSLILGMIPNLNSKQL
jgi:hypothetical protein